jgi:glycosyltransferase involved in cell wall biosynthesis
MKNLKSIFRKNSPIKVAYISSYIPRRCGIATYTKDLTNAINLLNPRKLAEIVAMHSPEETASYPWEVKAQISEDVLEDYREAARLINESDVDVVSLQHEFGLYGGKGGCHILEFINNLEKPLVTTIHTVITDPTSEYAPVLRAIADKSSAIVVMMEHGAKRLHKLYNIPKRKILVIPHGVPDIPFQSSERPKLKKQLQNRIVLGNINLLSPNKGVEYALEAVAEIAKTHPEVLYMAIGQTHPKLIRKHGEEYRKHLKRIVKKLGIQKNVKFINQYLELDELVDWLKAFDFYITPYLDPEQVTSGALAYAIGTGKLCVSTPYIYAREVLAENRGMLVPFKNSEAIAYAVISLWNNKELKHDMESQAYQYGRFMTWPNVAQQYLTLFRKVSQ